MSVVDLAVKYLRIEMLVVRGQLGTPGELDGWCIIKIYSSIFLEFIKMIIHQMVNSNRPLVRESRMFCKS